MIRYGAFISYSHADTPHARWLHHALETYRIPRKLVGTTTPVGVAPRRLPPIFRDRDELPASGDLGTELRAALAAAAFQIVLCSEKSAKSHWVNEEILAFKRVHGEHRTLALIVGGEPYSAERECFPPALRFRLGPDGELSDVPAEPIAADIRPGGDGKRLAHLKIVAGLTGLPLDGLVQRDAARRQRRLAYIAGGAVAVALLTIGLAVYANGQRLEAERQRRVAVEQRKVAQRESAAARAASDFLVGTFALANPARDNPRTVTAFTILARGADRARVELADQPDLQVQLIDTVARAYNNLGLYPEARAALEKSRPLFDRLGARATRPRLTLATTLFRQGDLGGALTLIDSTEHTLARQGTGDPALDVKLRAVGEELRGLALTDQNDLGGALAAYNRALSDTGSTQQAKPEDEARLLNNRGLLLTMMGRYDDANQSLQASNHRYVNLYGAEHVEVAQSEYALAGNELDRGRPAKALPYINRTLAIYRLILDPANPATADALSLKGQIFRELHRPHDAASALNSAVAVYKQIFGKPHYLIGATEVYDALAVADTGDTARALEILDDAKHNYDIGYGHMHANHGDLLVNRATILARTGRIAEAQADCARGIAILDKMMDRTDALYATSVKTCANIAQQRGG